MRPPSVPKNGVSRVVEAMGRHSGYLALGASYGQPDILLVPEHRLNVDTLIERIKEIYDLQKHCVIVCGEGIVDANGHELGAELSSTDPAGNVILSGAAEALRSVLVQKLGDTYFTSKRRNESAIWPRMIRSQDWPTAIRCTAGSPR